MTTTSTTIVFFGTEQFSATALQAMIEAGYSISAVVTKPDSMRGRGHRVQPSNVKLIATKYAIPILQPEKLQDAYEELGTYRDSVGVLVSYGKIIPQNIIDLFKPGIINVHPSLLPKYRGPSPIESSIAAGDSMTGVSIMQLSSRMDAGGVYTARDYPITSNETGPGLRDTLAKIGAKLLVDTLPEIIHGTLQPKPQNETDATYCHLLRKEDGDLNLSIISAHEAERRVRAYLDYPKCRLSYDGHTMIIKKSHVSAIKNSPLDFICLDGEFLCVDELVAPSGKTMDAEAFLRGYSS